MLFKLISKDKISALPTVSGVYAFKPKKGALLYIGKAINIKERVRNHFQQPTFKDNIFIPETEKIGFIVTGSEIEALILEARLIKKYLPKYNTIWRDGKSNLYIFITKEEFPRVFVSHLSPKIFNFQFSVFKQIGPFVDGQALKQTLRVLRRIFPFRTCRGLPKKICLYYDLKLCPAPCINKITKAEYTKDIKKLLEILQGKKPQVLRNLKKEMAAAAKSQNFETAKILRDQMFALERVFANAHILQETSHPEVGLRGRIEGYDISNIQGQEATGSMVVFENGQPNKNEYRKFHIKIEGKPNDTAMLKEIIQRRLKHAEWPMPQIMLIDGGIGQLNVALKLKTKNEKLKDTKIISLAKRKNELFLENRQKPVLLKDLPQETANLILRIRDEAHRFAITYHKKLRSKLFLP